MVYLNSFSVLQQRNAAAMHVDLCAAMDICAVATEESLALYRTISWERIYHIKCSEVFGEKTITALAFSLVGKCVTLGFSDGSMAILDIETTDIISAKFSIDSESLSEGGSVQSFAWQKQNYKVEDMHVLADRSWLFGGLNQIQRAGMAEYSDPSAAHTAVDSMSISLTSPNPVRRELVLLLSEHLLLSLTSGGYINCHVIGIYPLFRVSLSSPNGAMLTSLVPDSYAGTAVLVASLASENSNTAHTVTMLPAVPLLRKEMQWLEQVASLHLCIESDLARLQELVLGCNRKWKEAVKVVLPKLSLLQTLLDTYQMSMTPVEFCYTISLCGLWHPAAATAFSQHWNEQGIQRLRATVDTAGRSIIKLLLTKALPMATNALLAARELLAVTERLYRGSKDVAPSPASQLFQSDLQQCTKLVGGLEQMIMKIDEALLEARLARETMLLYIQFIKDCAYDVAAAENTTTPPAGTKPDLSLRVKYQKLFDPRCKRASSKGAAAQAEHVTGTHLYAYLQDAAIAPTSRSTSVSAFSAASTEVSPQEEILNMSTQLAHENLVHCTGIDKPSSAGAGTGHAHTPLCNSSHAVVHFIKAAKEVAQALSRSLHDTVSSQLQQGRIRSQQLENTHERLLDLRCSSESDVSSHYFASTTAAAVSIRLAEQCLMLKGERTSWEDHHLKTQDNEDGEPVYPLQSCLVTACVTEMALTVVIRPYCAEPVPSNALHFYASFSLDSFLQAMVREDAGAENSMEHCEDTSPSTPYSTSHVRDSRVSLYNRPSSSGAANMSVLLALELSAAEVSDTRNIENAVFLHSIALENVVFTPITAAPGALFADAGALSCNILAAAIKHQRLPEDAFKCRQLPLHSLGRLCARGERGVALVGDRAGKVVILDVEADEEEDASDSSSEGEGSDGDDAEGSDGEGDGEDVENSKESSGADMSTSSCG